MLSVLPHDPQPYVVEIDRESKIPTIFYLQCESAQQARMWQLRMTNATALMGPGKEEQKARVEFQILTERLLNIVQKVENVRQNGDCIKDEGELKALFENLDMFIRNELVLAACSVAQLEPGLVKNLKSSPSTSKDEPTRSTEERTSATSA